MRIDTNLFRAAALACCLSWTLATASEDYLAAVVTKTPPVIDGDGGDAAWQAAPRLEDAKYSRGELVMTLAAVYDAKHLYLLLDVRFPAGLGEPEAALVLRPRVRGHTIKKLDPEGREYFRLPFSGKGLGEAGPDGYDGTPQAATRARPDGGYTLELALPWPETVEYLPAKPVAGDYWDVAVYFKPQHMRKPMYFFTNRHNRPGPAMGKAILAGDAAPDNPALFFDRHATWRDDLDALDAHLAVLEALGRADARRAFARERDAWQRENEAFAGADYYEARAFQTDALRDLVRRAGAARIEALAALPSYARENALVFGVPCWLDAEKVDTFTLPTKAQAERRRLRLRVCPEETDAVSAAFWRDAPTTDLSFDVTPFQARDGKPVDARVEPYWVKCWYQGFGYTELTQSRVELMPELLVRDPDLVQVDHTFKHNVLRVFNHADSLERLYPDDSETLLPVRRLPARALQQAWVKVTFPKGTPPGRYRATLRFTGAGKALGELPIEAEVLPLELGNAPLRHQIYTRSRWGEQDEAVARAEIASLAAHGVHTVGLYEKPEHLPRVLGLMRDGGLSIERVYLQGDGGFVFYSDMTPEAAAARTRAGLTAKTVYGVQDVYFYLPDEAKGERLKKSVAIAEAIHAEGGKTWGAAHLGWYEIAGKSFNHVNISGPPKSKAVIDRVHADGNEIFVYNWPQGGLEAPERYRRHFGVLLWGAGYDGNMTWCWWWPYAGVEADAWNEFDEHFWKQHCMVYPTRTGVVDTIQYEGWAKGIYDTRYLGALLAKAKALPATHPTAKAIAALLAEIRANPYAATADLDALRDRMIDLLLRDRENK